MSELLSARKILTSASSRSSIAIKLESLLLTFLLLNVSVVSAASVPETFSVPNGGDRFQHLVVDKETGLVYVGGVNRLYQLSLDLDLQVTVETGPREDSPECPAVGCSDSVVKRLTDNVNKALVIDYKNTSLITCGTLFQGANLSTYHFIE
jgi:plexin A